MTVISGIKSLNIPPITISTPRINSTTSDDESSNIPQKADLNQGSPLNLQAHQMGCKVDFPLVLWEKLTKLPSAPTLILMSISMPLALMIDFSPNDLRNMKFRIPLQMTWGIWTIIKNSLKKLHSQALFWCFTPWWVNPSPNCMILLSSTVLTCHYCYFTQEYPELYASLKSMVFAMGWKGEMWAGLEQPKNPQTPTPNLHQPKNTNHMF